MRLSYPQVPALVGRACFAGVIIDRYLVSLTHPMRAVTSYLSVVKGEMENIAYLKPSKRYGYFEQLFKVSCHLFSWP